MYARIFHTFLLLKMSIQGPYTNKHMVIPIRITSSCKNQNIKSKQIFICT